VSPPLYSGSARVKVHGLQHFTPYRHNRSEQSSPAHSRSCSPVSIAPPRSKSDRQLSHSLKLAFAMSPINPSPTSRQYRSGRGSSLTSMASSRSNSPPIVLAPLKGSPQDGQVHIQKGRSDVQLPGFSELEAGAGDLA